MTVHASRRRANDDVEADLEHDKAKHDALKIKKKKEKRKKKENRGYKRRAENEKCGGKGAYGDRNDDVLCRVFGATKEGHEGGKDGQSEQCAALDDGQYDWVKRPRVSRSLPHEEDPPRNCPLSRCREPSVGRGKRRTRSELTGTDHIRRRRQRKVRDDP